MGYGSMMVAAAALTLLSGMAMAEGNGKPRFDVQDQDTNSFGKALPSTPGSRPDWEYVRFGHRVPRTAGQNGCKMNTGW